MKKEYWLFRVFRNSFIILFIWACFSCDSNRVFEQYLKIPDSEWDAENIPKFNVNISDTASAHNIYINLRHSNLYSYSNLFLFINITAPNGNFLRDTVELNLADKSGRWLGKGIGNIMDYQQLYQENVRFPFRGVYIFEFEQGMRENKLSHILDVGLSIEKSKSK